MPLIIISQNKFFKRKKKKNMAPFFLAILALPFWEGFDER